MKSKLDTTKGNIKKLQKEIGKAAKKRRALMARINGEGEMRPLATTNISVLKAAEIIELNKVPTEPQRLHLVALDVWNNTRITLQ